MRDSISELTCNQACPVCKERLLEYVGLPDEYAVCRICGRAFRDYQGSDCYMSGDEVYSLEDFPIVSAKGKYAFLHYSYPVDIELNGVKVGSEESAYNMLKCANPQDMYKFSCVGAAFSNDVAKLVEHRADWDKFKKKALVTAISAKYQDEELQELLKSTGFAKLLLSGPDGMGTAYGKLLMTQRATGFTGLRVGYESEFDSYARAALNVLADDACLEFSYVHDSSDFFEIIEDVKSGMLTYGLIVFTDIAELTDYLTLTGIQIVCTARVSPTLHCFVKEDEICNPNPYVFCSMEVEGYLDCNRVYRAEDTGCIAHLLATGGLRDGSMLVTSYKTGHKGLREVDMPDRLLKYKEPLNFALIRLED